MSRATPSHAVKAQETLSSSMASKAEVAMTRIRIQDEQALHSMLNELYAVKPRDAEHAAFLQSRRSSLLGRLKAFDTAGCSAVVSTPVSVELRGDTCQICLCYSFEPVQNAKQ